MSLDLRKLAHFTAVAEELNFTRAAERLHLSQQALSTSIRQLERELGVTLLDRSTRHVELTDCGRALLRDGRSLLALSQRARERVRAVDRGEAGELRVGHTPAVTGEQVRALAEALRERQPQVSVSAQQLFPAALVERLLTGDLDIGLARALNAPPALVATTLGQQRLHVAVSAEHPLATRGSVELGDLAQSRIVVWGQPGRSGYADLLVGICRDAGFEPRFEIDSVQGTPPVTAVSASDRVAFVTTPPGSVGDAVVLELQPEVSVPLQALVAERAPSPMVHEFIHGARDEQQPSASVVN